MKPKIGEYRVIPAGQSVWSIGLQETIQFASDAIVEITNTVENDEEYFFGKIKILFFNMSGHIPKMIDKTGGNVGPISMNKTKPYKKENYGK